MSSPAPRRAATSDGPKGRLVACQEHAFDESLCCPCGTTWFEHQSAPRPCRVGAQRGRCEPRARVEPDEG